MTLDGGKRGFVVFERDHFQMFLISLEGVFESLFLHIDNEANRY